MDVKEALKILNISNNNYTREELDKKYKKMAIQVHPDRGGSDILFNMVTTAYKTLKNNINNNNKPFNELRNDSKSFIQKQYKENKINPDLHKFNNNLFSDNFNDTFNRVFEYHRQSTPFDKGYDYMMDERSDIREDIDIPQNKKIKNMRDFNDVFDNLDINKHNKKLMKYTEPEALPTSWNTMKYANLVQDNIDDFSDEINGLNCVDYRKAYTTTKLVDKKYMKNIREDFNSIDELKANRENISYKMSEEDIKKELLKKKKEEEYEKHRLRRLYENDRKIAELHNLTNAYMLKYRDNNL